MTDPAIAELLSFFDFAHLPPHLAAASEPFHQVAHALADGNPGPIVDLYVGPPYMPGAEGAEARRKLGQIHDALLNGRAAISGIGPVLRTLLEAKDCAVRAALVRHREQRAAEPVSDQPKPEANGQD